MISIDINQAKNQLSNLVETALTGEEIIITRDQHPILKLSPINPSKKRRQRGSAAGQIQFSSDFDEPLADFKEYM